MLADQEKAWLSAPRALNDNQAREVRVQHTDVQDIQPTLAELFYLRRGLVQPGGKLPLFDLDGQAIAPQVVRACLKRGWAEPWFGNPLKPDWLVCRLTETGRRLAGAV